MTELTARVMSIWPQVPLVSPQAHLRGFCTAMSQPLDELACGPPEDEADDRTACIVLHSRTACKRWDEPTRHGMPQSAFGRSAQLHYEPRGLNMHKAQLDLDDSVP